MFSSDLALSASYLDCVPHRWDLTVHVRHKVTLFLPRSQFILVQLELQRFTKHLTAHPAPRVPGKGIFHLFGELTISQ